MQCLSVAKSSWISVRLRRRAVEPDGEDDGVACIAVHRLPLRLDEELVAFRQSAASAGDAVRTGRPGVVTNCFSLPQPAASRPSGGSTSTRR
jgi:hypothetical protein